MEPKQPLANELNIVGLGYLPHTLALWRDINEVVRDALVGKTAQARRDAETKGLTFDDIHYILCNVGITYSYPEFLRHMETRAQLENMHETLHRRFLKLRYQASPARYSTMLEDGNISQRAIMLTIDHMKYVFCCTIVLPSFLVCDVSYPSIAPCLHSLTRHDV